MKYSELDKKAEEYGIFKTEDDFYIIYTNHVFRIEISKEGTGIVINTKEPTHFQVSGRNFEFLEDAIELAKTPAEDRVDSPTSVWNLNEGDRYFFVREDGTVTYHGWRDTIIENDIRDMGNIFLPQQEAEDEVRKRKLIAKAKKSQRGFKPDWGDEYQWKYLIVRSKSGIGIDTLVTTNLGVELGCWETRKDAEKFLKENEPELEWYFELQKQ